MLEAKEKLRNSIDSLASTKSGYQSTHEINSTGSTEDLIHDTEDVLALCGDAGKWQLRVFFLAFFAGVPAGLQDFLYIFIAATPDHWCKITECPAYSYDYLKNVSIPVEYTDGVYGFSKCSRYLINMSYYSNGTCEDVNVYGGNVTECCSEYDWDTSVFKSTIVTEWNLVCGNEFWTSTSQAVYALGSLTGSLIFGIISDNYGRKKAIMLSLLTSITFGPLVAYAPTYAIFLAARYFLAVGSPGIYDISYILIIEVMSPDWRGMAGNAFGIPYAVGYASLAGAAWFLRSWRDLQLALTAAPVVFLILMFFVPESPRWLLSKGKTAAAEKILRDIAKTNGKKLPDNFSQLVGKLSVKAKNIDHLGCHHRFFRFFADFSNLFRTPKMRLRTLVLNYCWISTVLIYFGIALNAPNLSANLFLYTCLSGLLEIPSYLMVPPLLKYIGRRVIFSTMLFICGAALGFSLLFEQGTWPTVALALVGMFHIGGAYALMYLYGIELMPTSVRTYGIGLAAISGKVGNAVAPYIAGLLGKHNKKAPTMVFAGVAVVAALLSLLLPETKGKRLPENVDDVEKS